LLATCEKDKFIEQGIEQGLERGIQKGMVAGRNEGQKQEALRIAREMLQNGLSVDKVAKITGLSLDEVEGIGLGK